MDNGILQGTHLIQPQGVPCSITGIYRYTSPESGLKGSEMILVRTLTQNKKIFSTPVTCRWVKSSRITKNDN